jgi:hypothetical protein
MQRSLQALNSRMGVRGLPTIVVFASGIDVCFEL